MTEPEVTEPSSDADVPVVDDADTDETVPPVRYDITSYGADPEAELLVQRLRREDILIPAFQRSYVWTQPQASRFIESLLLGLPVPGVFLAQEANTAKQLVIDGQQRLKSLQFFYDGYFNPRPGDKTKRVFSLIDVQKPFEGCTYDKLDERDRNRLNTAILHTTIVRQTSPPDDDTSLYHIFERLNSGGQRLAPQEIRAAIYHGPFLRMLAGLNDNVAWRTLFGRKHSRLKDQELILRFFALYFDRKHYERPMHEFLSKYANRMRHPTPESLAALGTLFDGTCAALLSQLGEKAFRAEGRFNMALADSVLVGVAERIQDPNKSPGSLEKAFEALLKDQEFQQAISHATADEAQVALRLRKASSFFNPST